MSTDRERPHILIRGEKKAGKSTLIRRLLSGCARPVYGFVTVKEPGEEDGLQSICMYPASLPPEDRVRTAENRIGRCGDGKLWEVNVRVFETLGTDLIRAAKPGGILVMDELGFLEADVPAFTDAVFRALEGDIPVLAAVKATENVPFLNAVRKAEKARLFTLTPASRESLFETLSAGYPFSEDR